MESSCSGAQVEKQKLLEWTDACADCEAAEMAGDAGEMLPGTALPFAIFEALWIQLLAGRWHRPARPH